MLDLLEFLGSFGFRARVFCDLALQRAIAPRLVVQAGTQKANQLKSNELLGSFGFRARVFCDLALQRAIAPRVSFRLAPKNLNL